MDYSVEAAEQFELNADLKECWTFFSDLSNIGSCIPGCESVTKIDDATAQFRVKLKVGYLSKTFEMKAKLKEARAPTHLRFTGDGPDAEISGDLDIAGSGDHTSVKYKIQIRAISVIGKTAVTMMGRDLVKKQASEFALCVKTRLES
ncbi:MAG: CoxG family protein [Nitrososphaerales archaeon]